MAAVKSLLLQEKTVWDAADTMESFARSLYAEKPDLFQNFYQVKRLVELADRRFRAGGHESLFDACSQRDGEACWAFKLHPRLNAVLNPRGVEMLPIHKDAFVVQTLENCSDILLGPNDLYSLCLCLWILQHKCISKIVIDVSVVARYHSAAFWELLRLSTKRLDAVELRGLAESTERFALHTILCGAVRLSELILSNFTLTPVVIKQLGCLLDRNKGVRVLVLRNVVLDTSVGGLVGIPESTGSEESDGEPDVASTEGSCECMAALAGSASDDDTCASVESSHSEECVAASQGSGGQATSFFAACKEHCQGTIRDWAPLFRRLEHYVSLSELEISGRRAALDSSLTDLASTLVANKTLNRLTIQVILPEGGHLAGWLALTKAIGQNEGLESLSFASSRFGSDAKPAMAALRAALEENANLRKLSVEDCGLSRANMLTLIGCIKRNTTLEELHIDALHDGDVLAKLPSAYNYKGRVKCINKSAFGDGRRTSAPEKGEPVRELNLAFARTQDLEPMFATLLSRSCETITALSIEGKVHMTDGGAKLLSSIFPICSGLQSVSLIFPAGPCSVVTMLGAMASSSSVSSLVVGGGWHLSGKAAQAFESMLRLNTSMTELTVIQPTRVGFEELKQHLRQGMQKNATMHKLRLLYDLDRKESRDYGIMLLLQRNRIIDKRLEDMASRVHGNTEAVCGTPNLDVEYYTTRLGLTATNPDYAGLEAKSEMTKKLLEDMQDLAARVETMCV